MKNPVKVRRLQRNQKRMANQSKLSLVSLMDIFTILVFFLMLNASDVQVLQNDKSVSLPKSSADTAAKENLLLLVNQTQILLQGESLASIKDVLAANTDLIAPLVSELTRRNAAADNQATSNSNDSEVTQATGKGITIMADQAMPYELLKKLMQSCAKAGYTDIALAVEHQSLASTNPQSEGA